MSSICMPSKRSLLGSTQSYEITKTSSFLSNVTANPAKVIAGFIDDIITLGRSFATREWPYGIWIWAIEGDIFITAAHIPGILNVEAVPESRKSEIRTELNLYESIFCYIQKYLDFYSSVDLFASRINFQSLYFLFIDQTQKQK